VRSDGSEFRNVKFSERGNYSAFKEIKYSDSISAATGRWLEKDKGAFVLGEEVANFGGGAYGATKGLPDKYPDRVLNTPISEAGFTGLGLGAAMSGMRPVVEIMFPDFSLVAADQIFNQIGKARHMYGNTTDIPLVLRIRIAAGCGYGGQHSMDPVGLYALFSGWRIIAPSNAFDYIGLFNTAMLSNDPVVIIEHHSLYTLKFPVPENDIDYCIPFGKARIVSAGDDITLITYGVMAYRCERLIANFKEKGISVEIIDLRTIDLPGLDFETIGESLKKTGVAVLVEEAPTNLSIGAKIAAGLTERYFDYLDSPVMRLTSLDVPNSVSRVLEKAALISDETIISNTVLAAKRQWK
jgi:2-oxoisovalerate dehydrogenase E1 component